uniref:Uncharacterized protein n=1 Tax=Schistocephalus solidus TaxID=70667 RepID=A0A0V0J676_SCHSO
MKFNDYVCSCDQIGAARIPQYWIFLIVTNNVNHVSSSNSYGIYLPAYCIRVPVLLMTATIPGIATLILPVFVGFRPSFLYSCLVIQVCPSPIYDQLPALFPSFPLR